RVRQDIEIIQRELPVDVLEFFFLTPLPGSEDHKALWSKGVEMDSDLNKYDLEHAVIAHPNMSKPEWEQLYRDAWRLYYTPEHIRTILRRAKACGASRRDIFHLMQSIVWFAHSPEIERVHPLQGGLLRLKRRSERRPTLPIEPAWRFYPGLVREFIVKQARFAYAYWRLYRNYRAVAAEPAGYTDHAIRPVTAEEESLELFNHHQSARDAVDHLRRVRALTA